MVDLSGKRVVVTRPLAQSEDMVRRLTALGAEVIQLPVIEIAPLADTQQLDHALRHLQEYDWLVLTSVNGGAAVWSRLVALGISSFPRSLKVACIGPKTAEALRRVGIWPDFVPDEYVAEAILPGLLPLAGLKVLLARAEIARPALPEAIRKAGGTADEIAVYHTLPAEPDTGALQALREGVDIITFTSPSTVHNFSALIGKTGLDIQQLPGSPLFACIGPVTAQALQAQGLQPAVMAGEYTTDGLIEALLHYENGV